MRRVFWRRLMSNDVDWHQKHDLTSADDHQLISKNIKNRQLTKIDENFTDGFFTLFEYLKIFAITYEILENNYSKVVFFAIFFALVVQFKIDYLDNSINILKYVYIFK